MIMVHLDLRAQIFEEIAALASRVHAAMAEEVVERRKYWFAGIPTELDLHAARKAVARRLKLTLETVESMLAPPVPPAEE
ncbi:hypothetical protein [Pseudotabrizicola algicola]|uniref:Uncharacterized protein n=1 Tax=Pseudotabrizicola algicola TaxID=2709381 RepID=A0A6B3RUK8_9RHOB|nr:hypothetical protein [Pseudotabrizicola algicola]NEX47625.1 hypothetical protein [Pseudotabrizicola algicola]